MPLPFEQPQFTPGMDITGKAFLKNLQGLANIVGQQSLQPGQFQGGGYNVQRPLSRPGGGGSDLPTIYVKLIDTVPGGGNGRKQNCAEVYYFDDDPIAFGWYPVYTDPTSETIQKIGIINFGYPALRGSVDIPIMLRGVDVYTITEADEGDDDPEAIETPHDYLVVVPFDLAMLPGTEIDTIDGRPQGPSKLDGSRDFYNDGGPCEIEE